jgi:hypothetical protein
VLLETIVHLKAAAVAQYTAVAGLETAALALETATVAR